MSANEWCEICRAYVDHGAGGHPGILALNDSAEIATLRRRLDEAAAREAALGVIDEIAAERKRQIEVEGWDAEHDAEHTDGSLAMAAACYAHPNRIFVAEEYAESYTTYTTYRPAWPKSWASYWWKPKDRRCDLIRAAALIVAEIERLDRAAATALRDLKEDDREDE